MNDINELRDLMFETLKALKDKDNPMDIERAKAVSNAAQVIVNSVKVEIDYLKVSGGTGSGFIPDKLPEPGKAPGLTVRTHRLPG
jgi:hypothetical protein